MITLYQFPRPKTFPNFSPFCVKLETYLKVANIPYKNVFSLDMSKNPKKLMPFIEEDGQFFGDSTLIIKKLINDHGDKVDFWLDKEQQAISRAISCIAEGKLVPIAGYFRWVYPQGWLQFRELILTKLPTIIKFIVGNKLSRKYKKRLNSYQLLAFNLDELLYLAKLDLQALSDYLGDKQFFFGDQISLADIIVFATFGNITQVPIDTPLKELASKFTNLQDHTTRILNKFYNEIK